MTLSSEGQLKIHNNTDEHIVMSNSDAGETASLKVDDTGRLNIASSYGYIYIHNHTIFSTGIRAEFYSANAFISGDASGLTIMSIGGGNINIDTTSPGDDISIRSAFNDINISAATNVNITSGDVVVTDDIYTVDLFDWSASANVTGFSGTPTENVYYRKLGKMVTVWFYFSGTSDAVNGASSTFTLPFASANNTNQFNVNAMEATNNGVTLSAAGRVSIGQNSLTCSLYPTFDLGSWALANAKRMLGNITYFTA